MLGAPGFQVTYRSAGDPKLDLWIHALRTAKLIERTTALIDHRIKLPRAVPVLVQKCGRINAYYAPRQHKVYLCAELVAYFAKMFARSKNLSFDDKMQRNVIIRHVVKASTFVLLHELGHALVGELELPVTGRNEDVADQLAAWVVLSTKTFKNLDLSLLSAADWFGASAEKKKAKRIADKQWDVHSLDKQRYYNLLCWAYGAKPARFNALASKKIPRSRRRRCRREYRQIDRAFSHLLAPHSYGADLRKKRYALLNKLIDDNVPPTADAKACNKAVVHGATLTVTAHIAQLQRAGKLSKDPQEYDKQKRNLAKVVRSVVRSGMTLCLTQPWSKARIDCVTATKKAADLKQCATR